MLKCKMGTPMLILLTALQDQRRKRPTKSGAVPGMQ